MTPNNVTRCADLVRHTLASGPRSIALLHQHTGLSQRALVAALAALAARGLIVFDDAAVRLAADS